MIKSHGHSKVHIFPLDIAFPLRLIKSRTPVDFSTKSSFFRHKARYTLME